MKLEKLSNADTGRVVAENAVGVIPVILIVYADVVKFLVSSSKFDGRDG